jgi:hypothetical protein
MQTEASGAPILAARDVVKSYGEGTVLSAPGEAGAFQPVKVRRG